MGLGLDTIQERLGFGFAVAAIGAIRERLERAAGLPSTTETHQTERSIVACLGRKRTGRRGAEVGVPADQRARRIAIDEVRCVRAAVEREGWIFPLRVVRR